MHVKPRYILLTLCIFLFSCKKEENHPEESFYLIGTWDCLSYNSYSISDTINHTKPPYNLVLNYEQGFILHLDQTYIVRRYNFSTSEFYTDQEYTGTWRISGDSIIFHNEDKMRLAMHFKTISNTEIQLTSPTIQYFLTKTNN